MPEVDPQARFPSHFAPWNRTPHPNPHPPGPLARDLDQHLEFVRSSPRDAAPLELIVARPGPGERETLEEAVLDEATGWPATPGSPAAAARCRTGPPTRPPSSRS